MKYKKERLHLRWLKIKLFFMRIKSRKLWNNRIKRLIQANTQNI